MTAANTSRAMNRTALRGLLCLVAACVAATVADPTIEAASNAGLFGDGRYTDGSNLDVLPALLASLALATLFVALLARKIAGTAGDDLARRLVAAVREEASSRSVALVPAVVGLELAIVYAMETLEQLAVAGHPLGGTVWLGAPVAVGLACYALAGVVSTFVLGRALAALTRAVVGLALLLHAVLAERRRVEALAWRATSRPACATASHPLASRSGKRAPPVRPA